MNTQKRRGLAHPQSAITRLSLCVRAVALLVTLVWVPTPAHSQPNDPLRAEGIYSIPLPSGLPSILPLQVPSTTTKAVTYDLNGKIYRIPRNYIVSLGKENSGAIGAISLEALLPNLAARTDENAACFSRRERCYDQVIVIGIDAEILVNRSNKDVVERIRRRALHKPEGPCGYEYYERDAGGLQAFVKQMPNNPWDISILNCELRAAVCNARENMPDGGAFYYIFSKKYLCEWVDVRQRVVALLNSFHQGR